MVGDENVNLHTFIIFFFIVHNLSGNELKQKIKDKSCVTYYNYNTNITIIFKVFFENRYSYTYCKVTNRNPNPDRSRG